MSEKNGRYYVTDLESGRKFCVEPIGDSHVVWGDINPATKEIEGNYGEKYRGSIDEKDSIIISIYGYTKEFNHIQFEYEIKFIDEQKRDRIFDEIKEELLLQDIEKLVLENDIPIILN